MPTDLRDAVAEVIVSHEWDGFPRSAHSQHNYYAECAVCQRDVPRIAEVALAALAEDPGDVPRRMAAGLREAIDYELTTGGESGLRELVASLDDPGSSALVAAVMSVRDGLVAHLAARAAKAEARVEHAEAGAQISSERLAKVRQELAEAKNLSGIRGKLLREAWDAHHATMDEQDALQRKLTAKEAEIVGLNRDRERWRIRTAEAEAKLHEVAMVRVWTNEDGKRFVFADDLTPILLPDMAAETTTTPARETA